ncbi:MULTISPECIES: glycoside hydrolase domain-containing protein [Bacillus]|uniref:glycoside hydrolase domain-containing protein n=2 Tax=Bacillaceae TaxID=186817 RepID=UPI000BAE54D0|nr:MULTISPECIES: glycoside hydrolase domain-containing protein [Bacillus]MCM3352813.1 DUF1906 domain-containing protein [Bacillus halotolerans]PAY11415.1 hypothetical protein CJU60_19435 [Bacillus sp. 7705b]QPZ41309.1 DUF1906 domain-containing protein [Bacillus halotolerans]QVN29053.1 DUF1906 domain-containing protein [Bacillus halotolerans]
MDEMVLLTQEWLNETYKGKSGYNPIEENGKTGWETMYALTRALQLELGIIQTSDSFGPTTLRKLGELGPISMSSNSKKNIVKIVQGALYCKGYGPGGLTGTFGQGTKGAIAEMQLHMGLSKTDGVVTPKVFKALLNMDSYILLNGASEKVRSIQQWLNNKYNNRENFYFMPCDGLYSRDTQKSLVYAIQYEEGLSDSIANGNFGPTTQRLIPVLRIGETDEKNSFIHLFQAALIFNGYNVPFDGVYSESVRSKVKAFQSFAKLQQSGTADFQTWASLLVSTGDPNRKGVACDSITQITSDRAESLKRAGYKIVGRYLTNAPGSTLNKKIQPGELETILKSGLNVFPIYQTYGGEATYFNKEQGKKDALAAYKAAKEYGFKNNTVIYFAVDYDAYGNDLNNNIIPHFEGINEIMNGFLGSTYKIGIYAPRNVCTSVSKKGLAFASFVSGMSTGFSGNLGYSLPYNWAFDQISTITVGSGSGMIQIDNDICSGLDNGVNTINEVSSENKKFFDQIDVLYETAEKYAQMQSDLNNGVEKTQLANELVAQYLRKDNYKGWKWVPTAGQIDPIYREWADKALGEDLVNGIVDPKSKTVIGTQHLMATYNAIIYSGGYSQTLRDFAGWTGDLLTTIQDMKLHAQEFNSPYDAATKIIGNMYQFSLDDLFSDVDAINLANKTSVGANAQPLNIVIRDYYNNNEFMNRFTQFVNNRFDGSLDKIFSEAEYYLNTNLDPVVVPIRLAFKRAFDVEDYSEEIGKITAQAFRDVIEKKMISE